MRNQPSGAATQLLSQATSASAGSSTPDRIGRARAKGSLACLGKSVGREDWSICRIVVGCAMSNLVSHRSIADCELASPSDIMGGTTSCTTGALSGK